MLDEHRVASLRADIERLAEEQGRMPTPGQVHALLHRHGVDGEQLEALLTSMSKPKGSRSFQSSRRAGRPLAASASIPTTTTATMPSGPSLPPLVDAPPEPTPISETLAAEKPSGEQLADDDWNDADPFALDDPESSLLRPVSTGPAAQLAVDLCNDYARSGLLTLVDVTTLAHRRGLLSHHVEDVLVALAEAGVEVSEERPESAYDGAEDLDGGAVRRRVGSSERDQLGAYFAAAGKIRLLTAEQEVRLGRAIRAGQHALEELTADLVHRLDATTAPSAYSQLIDAGRQAHRNLVSANLRLVVSIARLPRYQRSGVELADRIQDGNTGLMRAADKYDPELGYKFSTYATWWIRQSIDRGVGNRGRSVRLPVHVYESARNVRVAKLRLEHDSGGAVSLKKIADQVGMDAGEVAALLTWSEPVVSYDALVGADDDVALLELLSYEADQDATMDPALIVVGRQLASDLSELLSLVLTPREVEVLQQRFGLGGFDRTTLDTIGQRLGLTRERIRQIQIKALDNLRGDPRVDSLYEYLVDVARRDRLPTPLGVRSGPCDGELTLVNRETKRAMQ